MRYLLLMVRPFSFNTQPPEGGWVAQNKQRRKHIPVSTHSRLKAAGSDVETLIDYQDVSTHSRLKAAGCCADPKWKNEFTFQHTAA